tara:strand:- start:2769 stop:3764 length:996 start_codon:yes stop_codon:yes gene_type:complete
MRAELVLQTIKDLFPTKRPLSLIGPPGGGKTSLVRRGSDELRIGYIEKHMPTMLVEDFGVPDVATDNDNFGYKIPDWYPAEGRTDIPDEGILCFDDRNQASNDLQKVLANIQQARTLHGVPLKKGWMVVSTGNRQEDRAGANRVLSHLANRETVIELETHLDDSTKWMIENDVQPEVVSFLRFRPNLLHDFDPQRDQNPTPRSWVEGVSAILGIVSPDAEFECFKGAVGEGAAAEFVGFVKIYRKLPNPDNIIMNPTTADVPDDPATLYALSGAIAERATENNFERVCTYAERMPPEFSVLSVSYAARKKPELASTQAFTNWAINHQNVLF